MFSQAGDMTFQCQGLVKHYEPQLDDADFFVVTLGVAVCPLIAAARR